MSKGGRPRAYDPARDPHPTKWTQGYVSRAQHTHFMRTAKLKKYRGGMAYHTPPKGKGSVHVKLSHLPARLHPRKGRRRRG